MFENGHPNQQPIEVIDEPMTVPELAAARTATNNSHGVETLHHSAGRAPKSAPQGRMES